MTVVLLATYNGMKFLDEWWDSLRQQTLRDWTLLVRDDGSADGTVEWLERQARYDGRIHLVHDSRGRQGPAGNFGLLMMEALNRNARHAFFADQDDLWHPNKLQRQQRILSRAESELGRHTPVVVHSDLRVVNEHGGLIHPSLINYHRVVPVDKPLRVLPVDKPLSVLLIDNFVTGCAAGLNRPLLELATPLPRGVSMHDWWVAICAAAAGRVVSDLEPLVDYRQHPSNHCGAGVLGKGGFRRRFKQLKQIDASFAKVVGHAFLLRDRLEERDVSIATERLRLLQEYCRVFEKPRGPFYQFCQLQRLGLGHAHWRRRILLLLKLYRAHCQLRHDFVDGGSSRTGASPGPGKRIPEFNVRAA